MNFNSFHDLSTGMEASIAYFIRMSHAHLNRIRMCENVKYLAIDLW